MRFLVFFLWNFISFSKTQIQRTGYKTSLRLLFSDRFPDLAHALNLFVSRQTTILEKLLTGKTFRRLF